MVESAQKIAERMIKHYDETGEDPFVDENGHLTQDHCMFWLSVLREQIDGFKEKEDET